MRGAGTGYATHLEAENNWNHGYFNNGAPFPGGTYRCGVTPIGPGGSGETMIASIVNAVLEFDPAVVGPAPKIAAITQTDGTLMVSVTDEDDAVLADSPVVVVRCTDIVTGLQRSGLRTEDFAAPVTVPGVAVGHTYDCVAVSLRREPSVVVR